MSLYKRGVKVSEIAARYNVHITTVYEHLERAGVRRRKKINSKKRKYSKLTPHTVAMVRQLYGQGYSYRKIADYLNINYQAARRACINLPVQMIVAEEPVQKPSLWSRIKSWFA